MLLAALAPELEAQGGAVDVHVLVAQGGEPKGVVLFGVLLVADPDEGRLQQLDDRGEHLLPPQAALRHVLLEPLADPGQGLAEGDTPPDLGLAAHLPPFGVVPVLLAPAGVAPGRLQVAVRAGADPDVRPGRRYGQLANALQGLLVPDRAPLGVDVGEALAALLAADAGLVVRDIAQACGLGALDRIDEHGDGQTRIELLALVDGDGSRHESHLCRVSGTSLQQLPTDVPRRQEKQPFFAVPRPQEPPSSSASPMPTVAWHASCTSTSPACPVADLRVLQSQRSALDAKGPRTGSFVYSLADLPGNRHEHHHVRLRCPFRAPSLRTLAGEPSAGALHRRLRPSPHRPHPRGGAGVARGAGARCADLGVDRRAGGPARGMDRLARGGAGGDAGVAPGAGGRHPRWRALAAPGDAHRPGAAERLRRLRGRGDLAAVPRPDGGARFPA